MITLPNTENDARQYLTINEFIKSMREVFGSQIEYKATKGDQEHKSKGWKEAPYKLEIMPLVVPKKVKK